MRDVVIGAGKTPLVGILTVTAVLIGTATPASADIITFILTSDFCTGTCGTPSFGTVKVTDIGAGEVQVNVTLTAGETFAKTGAGGGDTLLFDLAGTPTLSSFASDPGNNQALALASTTAGSISAGPTGTWQYAVNCPTCGNGTSPPTLDSPIQFNISATGLSTASFVKNGNSLFFAADILGANGNTGDVGAPTSLTSVPEPTSILLLGTVLASMAFAIRKRRAA